MINDKQQISEGACASVASLFSSTSIFSGMSSYNLSRCNHAGTDWGNDLHRAFHDRSALITRDVVCREVHSDRKLAAFLCRV